MDITNLAVTPRTKNIAFVASNYNTGVFAITWLFSQICFIPNQFSELAATYFRSLLQGYHMRQWSHLRFLTATSRRIRVSDRISSFCHFKQTCLHEFTRVKSSMVARFCLVENIFWKTFTHVILIAASFYGGSVLKRRQA